MRPALGDEKVAIRPAWLQDSPVVAWSFAAMAFLATFALRYALDSELPAGFPFLTFFPAVILTTFLAGLWPGIGVAIAGGLSCNFARPGNAKADHSGLKGRSSA